MDSNLFIEKIQVENFRNLENTICEFSSNINCIFGKNGNGKTNLLEAIYYLANKKSFRKNTAFPQLLSTDSEKPQILINSLIHNLENRFSYNLRMGNEKFEFFKDSKAIKRKEKIPILFINPFDSYQFANTLGFRRSLFDGHLSLLSNDYSSSLYKFNRALKQRNVLLETKSQNFKEQIDALDESFSKYILELTTMREEYVKNLKIYLTENYRNLFSENHELSLEYKSQFKGLTQSEIKNFLFQNLEIDMTKGRTQISSNRDDYTCFFDGFNAYEFCSLGQLKMCFLSLLFAYIDLFRYKRESFPIVLIDDVSGELDEERWDRLIQFLETRQFQVFITTANEKFKERIETLPNSKKFLIQSGKISTL
ncbi:MAG: DNA replication/repair protein RecF [Bacteriovoracaceae bacterium]